MTDWSKYLPIINFTDSKELREAASEIAGIAENEQVPAVLVGGTALQFYGSPRFTKDVDFAALAPLSLKDRGKLSFGGEQLVASNGVHVDWIRRDDDYRDLYEAAVEDPQPDAPIPIARPEYLLAMKMAADRARDNTDVEWLISSGVANLKKTRSIVKRYLGAYAAKDFDSIVSEVEWRKSREEK
jgi:alpha-beta hydrolase superfamily lysophospholipase